MAKKKEAEPRRDQLGEEKGPSCKGEVDDRQRSGERRINGVREDRAVGEVQQRRWDTAVPLRVEATVEVIGYSATLATDETSRVDRQSCPGWRHSGGDSFSKLKKRTITSMSRTRGWRRRRFLRKSSRSGSMWI